jgi:hypothetical protein
MKKTSAFFWYLAICVLLSACNGQGKQSLAIPSNTPKPSATIAPTQTMVKPTRTPRPTAVLAATPTSYPVKQVLLDYTVGGFHTPFEGYYADSGMDGWSKLVLYTDGQLIIPGETYQQKILSNDEINQLFLQLETKGFFLLTQDNLYNFGNQDPPKVNDGTIYCVLTTGKREQKLCAGEPYESFLVPKMNDVLQFLNKYHPEGMTPYYPDRILLWVQVGRSPYVENLPKKAIPWPEKFSSLETPDEKIMYFEGDVAKKIFALFGNRVSFKVISQNSIEYTVSIEIVLPHEQLIQP